METHLKEGNLNTGERAKDNMRAGAGVLFKLLAALLHCPLTTTGGTALFVRRLLLYADLT